MPWPEIDWEEAPLPAKAPGVGSERVVAVASAGDAFVAVGYEERGPERDGIVWFSEDAIAWSRVGVPQAFEQVELIDVAADAGGYVAVGTASGDGFPRPQTVMYRSDDGRHWERLEAPAGAVDTYAHAVAAGPTGFVVTASGSQQAPAVWTSADGRSWLPVPMEELADAARGLVDPQGTAGGWVALGSNVDVPLLLRSEDGRGWAGTLIDGSGDAHAYRVRTGPWGHLVLGDEADCGGFSSCPAQSVAWWSADGTTWGRMPAEIPALTHGGMVLATDPMRGIVALDGIAAWSSVDGWDWAELPAPGDGSSLISDAIIQGNAIVAVGERYDAAGIASTGRIIVGRLAAEAGP